MHLCFQNHNSRLLCLSTNHLFSYRLPLMLSVPALHLPIVSPGTIYTELLDQWLPQSYLSKAQPLGWDTIISSLCPGTAFCCVCFHCIASLFVCLFMASLWEATRRKIINPTSSPFVWRQSKASLRNATCEFLMVNDFLKMWSDNLYKMVLFCEEGRKIRWCYTSICIYVFLYRRRILPKHLWQAVSLPLFIFFWLWYTPQAR